MNGLNRKLIKWTFNANDRMDIYDNFRQFLLDGAEVKKVYEKLILNYTRRGKKPNDAIALVLTECSEHLRNGKSLAESLSEWIPEQEKSVIEACDIAGNSADGFKEAIKIASAKERIGKSIRGTLFIMGFMFFNFFGILAMICCLMVPVILDSIPLERWNLAQKSIYYFYVFISEYSYIAIVILIGFIYLVGYSMPRWTGELRFAFDKFPPYSFYRSMQGTTFLTNIDAMLSSGMQLKDALKRIGDNSNSAWLKERIDAALGGLASGEKNLGTALDSSGYEFPSEKAIIKMQNLFETSNSEGSLTNFSDRLLESTIDRMEKAGKTIQVLSMFANALGIIVVCFVMYGLIQQMFNL